jgi:hypothetical protein
MADRVKVYKDKSGEYRWTRRAGNNQKVSNSGDGFERDYAILSAARYNADVPLDNFEIVDEYVEES